MGLQVDFRRVCSSATILDVGLIHGVQGEIACCWCAGEYCLLILFVQVNIACWRRLLRDES